MTALGRCVRAAGLALVFAVAQVPPGAAATRYDPTLRFRTLTTRHFHIYFHQGEERLARRLAVVAEEVHADLSLRMQASVAGRTEVVLVDQDDLANGFATVFPYNLIQIVAGPPDASSLIGNTDEWLKLVFAHEYSHILYLDRSTSFAGGLRKVFGRAPIVFPNGAQPLWQIEGLATFEETDTTGRGRMASGDFAALVVEPRRLDRMDPMDRANGGLVPWPGGNASYADGGFFFRYLKSKYGDAAIARLSETQSRGYYYLTGFAFKKVFGKPLGEVWRDYQKAVPVPPVDEASGAPVPTRLTQLGYIVNAPRYVPARLPVGGPHGSVAARALLFSIQNADDFPSMMIVAADGKGRPLRFVDRYLGGSIAFAGKSIVFDQIDLSRSIALKSDLYLLDPVSRRVTRLTRDARLVGPDVSPDGTRLAAVQLVDGVRTLVVFDRAALERAAPGRLPSPVLAFREPDVTYGMPRWAPDGQSIAGSRWQIGRPADLALIDATTGHITTLTSTDTGRDLSPAWCPDGRTIVFASDRDGGEFALYAVDVPETTEPASPEPDSRTLYRVAGVAGGAMSPDVSPDGTQIAYLGYTPAGYDLFTIPLDRATWVPVTVTPPAPAAEPTGSGVSSEVNTKTEQPRESGYSPVDTLLPHYWMPDIRTEDGAFKVGLTTGSADPLARHQVSARFDWRVAGGHTDEPEVLRPDWSVSYTYDRWRPSFFLTASDKTSFRVVPTVPGSPVVPDAELRDLEFEAGASLPFFTVRHAQSFQASFAAARNGVETRDISVTHHRDAVRLAWGFNNAKNYGFSISPEQGFAVGVTAEFVRRSFGADGDAEAYTVEVRAYPRLGGRHAILALRADAGTSSGDRTVRRAFYIGGSDAAGSLMSFGSDALTLLRGFDPNSFAGFHAVVLNVDYRRPLFRVDRGLSWLPVMARVVHGALFVDAGNVWWNGFSINDTKASAGGELSLDLVVGYALPLTVTVGGAWTRNGSSADPYGSAFYFRVGRAF